MGGFSIFVKIIAILCETKNLSSDSRSMEDGDLAIGKTR